MLAAEGWGATSRSSWAGAVGVGEAGIERLVFRLHLHAVRVEQVLAHTAGDFIRRSQSIVPRSSADIYFHTFDAHNVHAWRLGQHYVTSRGYSHGVYTGAGAARGAYHSGAMMARGGGGGGMHGGGGGFHGGGGGFHGGGGGFHGGGGGGHGR